MSPAFSNPRAGRVIRATLLLGVSLAAVNPALSHAATGSVIGLGSLGGNGGGGSGGYESGQCCIRSNMLSADGSTVVGDSYLADNSTLHAFRWSASGGMVDIDNTGNPFSFSTGVSGNGSVVVGYAEFGGNATSYAFRWTQAGGMVSLGSLGGVNSDGYGSDAFGISADGSTIVGDAILTDNSTDHAFRWTAATGMVDLGTLGGTDSWATAVSANGSVIAGYSELTGNPTFNGNPVSDAFRWTAATGMVNLGTLGGTADANGTGSYAIGISADGSTIVGFSVLADNSTDHAFRWTQVTGMVDLGTLGGTNSYAQAVSATGKIIVGGSETTGNATTDAFRWTQATGMQDLNTLLANAGVNMSGIQLTSANGISQNGQYVAGVGVFSGITEAFLVSYMDGTVDGLTTQSDVQTSTQNLSADMHATSIESRATSNELLGMTRPVDSGNYTYAGGLFGSALGYTGGQYSERGVTVLGGIAYGAQDYPNITQDDSITVATALRYTFDDPFGDEGNTLHPYAEIGGWIAPNATMKFTRSYANGSGTSTGTGETSTTSWAEYGRGGMTWDATGDDKFTGYAEFGQQYMNFAAYGEEASSSNTFPANVGAGQFRMDVARVGGAWTHKIDGFFDDFDSDDLRDIPVSITFAGAAAQSFDVHSGLTVTVPGVGSSTASNASDTWGEFGARIEAQFTTNLALDLDLNGTTGQGALGTAIHGGAGLSYKF